MSVTSLMEGERLSRFLLLQRVGAGGMGVVYRARDERLDREVAVKVLPAGALANAQERDKFHREAQALAKLNHPNIGMVYDFSTEGRVDFLVMEFVVGQTLAQRLASGSLPEKEVAALGTQICAALVEAHEHSIVHRDLKPGNIMVTPKGQAKVLDFGLAKLLRGQDDLDVTASQDETIDLAGTLPYMSPEQLRGEKVDTRSDIWALGALLYEMATGARPFPERHRIKLVDSILHGEPRSAREINRRLSVGLENILAKALEKEPENRYQSAKDLAVDLRRLGTPAAGQVAAPTRKPNRWRRMAMWAGAAAALLATVVGLNLGGLRTKLFSTGSVGKVESLAVLPLENLSNDPEQEYFADGMTEMLITDLAKIKAFRRVISRNSVMQYKVQKKPLREIARELNVDMVVTGSVLRVGHRVRIVAEVVEPETGRQVWSERYEREMQDVLGLQSEVAGTIAQQIQVEITPQEQARLGKKGSVRPEAQEAYLRGKFSWNQRSPAELEKSIEYFRQAIAKDPSYARAYAGLADAYLLLSNYNLKPPREVRPKAREAVLAALKQDESLGEAHAALAMLKWMDDWDWAGAEQEFQRAIELDPNYATVRQWYSRYLSAAGRHMEAIAQIQRARELDPNSMIIDASVGWAHVLAGDYPKASVLLRKSCERDPGFWVPRSMLGRLLVFQGKYTEAIAEFQEALRLSNGTAWVRAELGNVYGRMGRRKEAEEMLRELREMSKKEYISPIDVAVVHIGLGNREQAFHWLLRGVEEKPDRMVYLGTEGVFDPVRKDEQFVMLLRRIGYPKSEK